MFEVIRNGETIDLLYVPQYAQSGGGSLSPLLPGFMMGVLTAKKGMSESDASHMLRRILMEYERIIRGAGML